ncbi:outer membrane protein assembly factor BamB [Flavobacterium araucananum]|uniref:Pyrrolo-quinoline quinone n=1 Tax=Flavobacterium araucananum TaxID=946678 RepID=A0A227NLQ7_9FLAO|nr:PQQ-binding-like beta-propeller repeat protein [Flavobacterium araucananum]OXE98672.1 pyrrolo-quinoline quinone [Flavobacterium araucananum]PWJ97253.1 outer membrane protein assembly factor BamB [Flavobacterium araucananum]
MKKNLISLLFICTAINMFGQTPSVSKPGKTNYSNNKVLSPTDMVTNKAISPLTKVSLDEDSILIYDYDGSLISFSLETEDINWTVKASDANTEMCANQVTLKDGVVYVPFINGEIFAIDNQSGDVFWKARVGNITDQIILKNQILTINNGKLFVTTQNSNIYALDIKDGSLAWNYKLDSSNNDIPVLFFDSKIFTQSGSQFYSFDANTGKLLSQKSFDDAIYGKPVTDGENVFIPNEKNVLFALSPNKLDILWQFKLDENQNNVKERIFCKDKKIFFAAQGETVTSVYAVDSKTGTQLWKTDFKGDNVQYITEHNDNLWGYTRKAKLFELNLKTGEIIFDVKLTTLPISNIEFPDDESLFYYCDAGLIQLEIKTKDENVTYMRTTIKDDIYSAFIKIIQ